MLGVGVLTAVDLGWYLMLAAAGFTAGVVNTIAGGGSFLTLPALMLFGIEPKVANGTNRLAVLFSSAAAVATFRKHGHFDRQAARGLTLPTLLGVPVGALLAIYLPAEAFEPLFGVIFLVMAVLIAIKPSRLTKEEEISENAEKRIPFVFFAIGVYVGFIQAGMGILLLLGMSLRKTGDLVAASAIKNWIGFWLTLLAATIFALNGMIEWIPGLTMAAGNIIGGNVGARLAIKKGNRLIFGFLMVVMVATGIKLIVTSLL